MIQRYMKKAGGLLAVAVAIAACGAVNEALTDAQNRLILTDVSGETSTTGAEGESETGEPPAPPPECRGNPIKENCGDDAKTYCAEFLPTDDEEPPKEKRCGESFKKRQDKRGQLLDCLKENLASLSTSCQEAVNNAPPPPSEGGRLAGPSGHGGRPPRRPPPPECGGRSLLKDCVADARTLCEAELPIPGEPDGFTKEERHERVKTIITCLEGQIDGVSEACKAAIEALPPKR